MQIVIRYEEPVMKHFRKIKEIEKLKKTISRMIENGYYDLSGDGEYAVIGKGLLYREVKPYYFCIESSDYEAALKTLKQAIRNNVYGITGNGTYMNVTEDYTENYFHDLIGEE